MAISGFTQYRPPDLTGFQMLGQGIQRMRQRGQQDDFHEKMKSLEADFNKRPSDYNTDIKKVEQEARELTQEKPGVFDEALDYFGIGSTQKEKMQALKGKRDALMRSKGKAQRKDPREYWMKAERLKNMYGKDIDKHNPFTAGDPRLSGRGGGSGIQARVRFHKDPTKSKKDVVDVTVPLSRAGEGQQIYKDLTAGGISDPEASKEKLGFKLAWEGFTDEQKMQNISEGREAFFSNRLKPVVSPGILGFGKTVKLEPIPLTEWIVKARSRRSVIEDEVRLNEIKNELWDKDLSPAVMNGLRYRDKNGKVRKYKYDKRKEGGKPTKKKHEELYK